MANPTTRNPVTAKAESILEKYAGRFKNVLKGKTNQRNELVQMVNEAYQTGLREGSNLDQQVTNTLVARSILIGRLHAMMDELGREPKLREVWFREQVVGTFGTFSAGINAATRSYKNRRRLVNRRSVG